MKYLYLILMAGCSGIALFSYGADKLRAKHKRRRYPERLLLTMGLLFGAPGALLGMSVFHHKTRKTYFWVINWIGLAAQLALGWYLFRHF